MRFKRALASLLLLLPVAWVSGCSSESGSDPVAVPTDAAVQDALIGQDASTSEDRRAPDGPREDVVTERVIDDQAVADSAPDDDHAEANSAPDVEREGASDATVDRDVDAALDQGTLAESGEDGAGCQPLAGLGEVVCTCNALDETEWGSPSPFLFQNHMDFGIAGWDPAQLTAGGQQMLTDGNENDGSLKSEIAAYEALARCDFAKLLKSEKTIDYKDSSGKKTDAIVEIDGRKVGVGVVRAYHYPASNAYTVDEATAILTKKLNDVPLCAANIKPTDAWERFIVAVVAWDQQYADAVATAWNQLDASLRRDVIVFVTVTDGNDAALYP